MSVTVSFVIGYLLGGISPAKVFSVLKKKNLRESGTKNLGATNVTLSMGFKYGLAVLALDMLKGFSSVKIAKMLFPNLAFAGLIGGCGAVYGHIYPIYMKFKGGKGLAAFGGVILAYNPIFFAFLLSFGIFLIWITDYTIMLTFSATMLAPFVIGFEAKSMMAFLIMALTSGIIIYKHRANLVALIQGKESRWSKFVEYKKKSKEEHKQTSE